MADKKKTVKLSEEQIVNLFQAERNKLEVVQRRQQTMQRILMEIDGAITSLNGIKKGQKNEKIMVSLGLE